MYSTVYTVNVNVVQKYFEQQIEHDPLIKYISFLSKYNSIKNAKYKVIDHQLDMHYTYIRILVRG